MVDKKHPYKTNNNEYYMNPLSLKSIGIRINENCVACGQDQQQNDYYVDAGLIHCIECAFLHGHITEEEKKEHEKERELS